MLEYVGYRVYRSFMSRGTWDLVAVKGHERRYIQVRTNRKPTQKELRKLYDALHPSDIKGEVWVFYDRWPSFLKICIDARAPSFEESITEGVV